MKPGKKLHAAREPQVGHPWFRPAMSNPNGLLGQKSCRYLNQDCTFHDIL